MKMEREHPFQSDKVIIKRHNENDFNTFYVGFDIDADGNNAYRWKEFINVLQNVIPEFAFGHHVSIITVNAVEKICEAAKSVYKIKEFVEVKDLYDRGDVILDDDPEKEYLRRGEFGELILHLLLRDYHNTIPLISKLYFKDSSGFAVHGFDAVHIQPDTKTLWLGESKIYFDSKKGVKSLIRDIKNHITRDYLEEEFTLISKRVILLDNIDQKKYWLNLMDNKNKLSEVLNHIKIPLLCTYTSKIFDEHDDETEIFLNDFNNEVLGLKKYFEENNDHPIKSKLDIMLVLFPVKCKKELIKRMHKKLYRLQRIGSDE